MKKSLISMGIVSLLGVSNLYADQFLAAPGTKARSMGYAFSAVANNTSAIYYNPAGYVADRKYGVFTLEYGNASSFDQTENGSDVFSSDNQYFLGFGAFGTQSGIGFAAYSLYDVYFTGTNNYAAHQSNEVVGLAYSYRLFPRLSVGFSANYVSKIFASDESEDDYGNVTYDTHNGKTLLPFETTGSFFQVGALLDVLKDSETGNKLTLSYTYKTEADLTEDKGDYDYTQVGVEPWDLPEETVMGAAITYGTSFASFLVTYDRKETTYTLPAFASSTTNAFGLEIGFDGLSIRAGQYESTPKDEALAEALATKGTTYGLNWQFSTTKNGGGFLEFASDTREIEAINSKNTFNSLSLNWQF